MQFVLRLFDDNYQKQGIKAMIKEKSFVYKNSEFYLLQTLRLTKSLIPKEKHRTQI